MLFKFTQKFFCKENLVLIGPLYKSCRLRCGFALCATFLLCPLEPHPHSPPPDEEAEDLWV